MTQRGQMDDTLITILTIVLILGGLWCSRGRWYRPGD
jgi:hypothetical protein